MCLISWQIVGLRFQVRSVETLGLSDSQSHDLFGTGLVAERPAAPQKESAGVARGTGCASGMARWHLPSLLGPHSVSSLRLGKAELAAPVHSCSWGKKLGRKAGLEKEDRWRVWKRNTLMCPGSKNIWQPLPAANEWHITHIDGIQWTNRAV